MSLENLRLRWCSELISWKLAVGRATQTKFSPTQIYKRLSPNTFSCCKTEILKKSLGGGVHETIKAIRLYYLNLYFYQIKLIKQFHLKKKDKKHSF